MPTLSDVLVLADRPLEEQIRILRELGDERTANQLAHTPAAGELGDERKSRGLFDRKPWQHSAHRIGFIAPVQGTSTRQLPIVSAADLQPDKTLIGASIDLKLDRLRVVDYPGGGKHQVLITFDASHGAGQGSEALTFNQAYEIPEGDSAGVVGFPIFRGLVPGSGGLDFHMATTNVKNTNDEAFLAFLNSGAVAKGLELLSTAQPALGPLVEVGKGLAETIASRNRNVKVQDVILGLDFDASAVGVRLREGNYLAVQINEPLDWSEWVYDRTAEAILRKSDQALLAFNHVIFRVSRS